jgi:hypothetical protein
VQMVAVLPILIVAYLCQMSLGHTVRQWVLPGTRFAACFQRAGRCLAACTACTVQLPCPAQGFDRWGGVRAGVINSLAPILLVYGKLCSPPSPLPPSCCAP